MPMYTYKCTTPECTGSTTKIIKLQERENVKFDCPVCNAKESMIFTAFIAGDKGANLHFKGNWVANGGSY